MNPENLTLGLALIAGLVSFVSPCVLPLVPAYIGYMGGRVTNTVSAQMAAGGQIVVQPTLGARFTTIVHGLFFVAGFTFVFVVSGLLLTVFIQEIGGQNVDLVRNMIGRIGGVIIILFGLHFMGVLPRFLARLQANPKVLANPFVSAAMAVVVSALILWGLTGTLLPTLTQTIATTAGESRIILWPTIIALVLLAAYLLWLVLGGAFTRSQTFWLKAITTLQTAFYADTRRQMAARGQQSYSSSAIMGVVFAAGWTPCIGPVYGAVLTLAANTGNAVQAAPLLIAYSLGLGIPFLLTALLLDSAQGLLRRLQRHMHKIELASGAFLVLIGLLVASGSLQNLSQYLSTEFADFSYDLEESVIGAVTGANPDAAPTAVPESGTSSSEVPAVGLITIEDAAAVSDPVVGTAVGNLAPDFETVNDTGEMVRLADLRGQVVLLNFWATWCGPCRVEMPEFESAFQSRKNEGFTILAINNGETVETVADFRKELGVSFPLLMDEKAEIQQLYAIAGYPTTFLLDRSGMIIAQQSGPLTAEQIRQLVDRALAA